MRSSYLTTSLSRKLSRCIDLLRAARGGKSKSGGTRTIGGGSSGLSSRFPISVDESYDSARSAEWRDEEEWRIGRRRRRRRRSSLREAIVENRSPRISLLSTRTVSEPKLLRQHTEVAPLQQPGQPRAPRRFMYFILVPKLLLISICSASISLHLSAIL